jgi:DNA helicase MCM8
VCGNTTSASGLTVTISKDPQTGATTLEGGALVLGDQGVCCIDEFDKMNDHHALLEAMEQQSISIAKAGIVCTLPARTTVLAAANPVQGHYNKCKSVSENLKMKGALLSRFDLVFILIDKADAHMDKVLSEHIMKIHAKSGRTDISRIAQAMDNDSILSDDLITRLRHFAGKADPIPSRIMRKYIAYCRLNCHPKLSKDAADLLNKFYLKLRSDFRSRDSTPVTTRQLEAMIRLSEARAKCEMRNVVTLDDARDAIEIIKFSLSDVETAASTVKGKRGQVKTFLQEIQHMARETGNSSFTMDGFAKIAQTKNLQFSSIRDVVENLNVQGYLLKRANGIYDLAI